MWCPGVLRLLESQCKMPAGSDSGFFESVNRIHGSSEFFKPVQLAKKLPSESFIISHFAGNVCYGVEIGSWLERESDSLPTRIEAALCASDVQFVATVMSKTCEAPTSRARQGSGPAVQSISRRFIKDLAVLMEELNAGETQFVRCIKPNERCVPGQFVPKLVLEQLRASGIFEAVELMKTGYPIRLPFTSLQGKFANALPPDLSELPPASFCEKAALACDVSADDFAIGTSQLFLRTGQGALLEQIASMDTRLGGPMLALRVRDYERRCNARRQLGGALLTLQVKWRFRRRRQAARQMQAIYRGLRSRRETDIAALRLATQSAGSVRVHAADTPPLMSSPRHSLGEGQPMEGPPPMQQQPWMPQGTLTHQGESTPPLQSVGNVRVRTSDTHTPMSSPRRSSSEGQSRGPATNQEETGAPTAEVDRLRLELSWAKADNTLLRQQMAAIRSDLDVAAGADQATVAATRQMSQIIEDLRSQLQAEQQRTAGLMEDVRHLRAHRQKDLAAQAGENPNATRFDLSPRLDLSSPRRDISPRLDLSPRSDVSPRLALSPRTPRTPRSGSGHGHGGDLDWPSDALPAWLAEAEMGMSDVPEYMMPSDSFLMDESSIGGTPNHFPVNIARDEVTGTLGVDIDVWQGRVTVAAIATGVPAVGKLQVGDQIVGVGGVLSNSMQSILKAIVESPEVVSLYVCRRTPVAVLRAEMQMRTSKGTWQYVMATLLSTRMLLYELPQETVDTGAALEEGSGAQAELNVRLIQRLEVVDEAPADPDDSSDATLPILAIVLDSGEMVMLRCTPLPEEGVAASGERLRSWHSQISRMRSGDKQDSMRGMVWQQGYVELSIGLDEWTTRYFVLDEERLCIFGSQPEFRANASPNHIVPRLAIGKVLRSTGLSYFEWGLQIHLIPTAQMVEDGMDSLIEARAPNNSEMLRWLAALNLRGTAWRGGANNATNETPANRTQATTTPPPSTWAKGLSSISELHSPPPPSKSVARSMSSLASASTPGRLSSTGGPRLSEASPRNYSPIQDVLAPRATVDILSGWFTLRREHALGSKRRLCKLIGILNSGGEKARGASYLGSQIHGSSAFKRVDLVILRNAGMSIERGRTINLAEVTSLTRDAKVPARVMLHASRRRKLTLRAESPADAERWLDALRAHTPAIKRGSRDTLAAQQVQVEYSIGSHVQGDSLRLSHDEGRDRSESHGHQIRTSAAL